MTTNSYYPSGVQSGFLRERVDIGFRTNSYGWTNGNLVWRINELGLAITNTWTI